MAGTDTAFPRRITAGLLWPVSAPPLLNGALLIDATGRIAALGTDQEVPRPPHAQAVAYPEAAVLPGFVNVHTHLELSTLRGQVPERDFFEWIQHLRRLKEAMSWDQYLAAARAGVVEAWRHGTTTVADTGTSGATITALRESGGRGIYYHEVIAPDPGAAGHAVAGLEAALVETGTAPGHVRVGVSPHAPYTVSPGLIERAARTARAARRPLAMHVAESHAEVAFVTEGTGPFAAQWRARGIPLPPRHRSPVAYLDGLGLLAPDFLAVHVVHADGDDLAALRRAGAAVAVCLRSNGRHGHGTPSLAALLGAGIRVGLGTDSAASVDTLDLLAEARAASDLAGLAPAAVLALLTLGGARALGLEREIGSLEVGKWADLCVIAGAVRAGEDAAAAALLTAGPDDVAATYVAGRVVHTHGQPRAAERRRSVVESSPTAGDLPSGPPAES